MDTPHEQWVAGDAYEHFMGRWSSEVASRFLRWLDVPPHKRWLDVGCGTGRLTQAIAEFAQPQLCVGFDRSLDFAQYAHQKSDKASFFVADGSNLAISSAIFDVIVSGLVLNFIPQPEQALKDMYRVTKEGGIVATYVWDYAGKMEFLRYFWDVAVALDAKAIESHEGHRFPICQPEPLRQLWEDAGFKQIAIDEIDIPTMFNNFEEYWQLFIVGDFPAPKYALSLDEIHLNQLRDRLRDIIPTSDDGSIPLIARVWAIRGYR